MEHAVEEEEEEDEEEEKGARRGDDESVGTGTPQLRGFMTRTETITESAIGWLESMDKLTSEE
jgi:hypothetical protein